MSTLDEKEKAGTDFIRTRINQDNENGRFNARVHTRFPPEPNGYLHIGHAKSICLNFGIAKDYNGLCNLRFDDTNPVKEDTEYVDSIQEDVKWLGFSWAGDIHYASDYFDRLYELAEELIKRGKAYVCELNADQIREYRGTLTEPGKESPYRNRSVEENLDLFRRMKAGEFADGQMVLRAKIDMASPNIIMRDPALYMLTTTKPAINGIFIPCMISPTAFQTALKTSLIPFVPWNLKTTANCTIGSWTLWIFTTLSR